MLLLPLGAAALAAALPLPPAVVAAAAVPAAALVSVAAAHADALATAAAVQAPAFAAAVAAPRRDPWEDPEAAGPWGVAPSAKKAQLSRHPPGHCAREGPAAVKAMLQYSRPSFNDQRKHWALAQ
eukprot:1150762-Pelagomonas_calceolata.AAC.4